MNKIYVAFIDTGSMGSYSKTAIAVSFKKKGLKAFAINIANKNEDLRKIGIVDRELVYIDYKTNDVKIEEIPLMEK